ncbi:MAG: protein kinase, partial [Gemmatimonadales bacterium]
QYAHQHGIVHRDIKPENILLHGGHAMVADFGIALAAARSEGGTRMTETGMSLGTPHYMAPEQAMGEREITPKADIYALGCVLYEMLTGDPPFTGSTAQAIVARVLTETPRALTAQRHTIPPHVEAIVLKALEKLPADRFAKAAEFAEALEKGASGWTAAVPATRAMGAAPRSGRRARALQAAPWVAVVVLAAALGWSVVGRRSVPGVLTRYLAPLPVWAQYADPGGRPIAVAPDGGSFVYNGVDSVARLQLFMRTADRLDPVALPGTLGGVSPTYSPDGRWLSFINSGRIYRAPVSGGAPALVCDCRASSISWGSRDRIAFESGGLLGTVPATGGAPTPVGPDSGRGLALPSFLPDGKHLIATQGAGSPTSRLVAVDINSGRRTDLGLVGTDSRYVEPGFIVYGTFDLRVFAAPFNARRLKVTGASRPIIETVPVGSGGAMKIGVGASGAIVYPPATTTSSTDLVLVERGRPPQMLPTPGREFIGPRFSPDGKRIAVVVVRSNGDRGDAWIYDLAAKTLSRLSFDSTVQHPEWTPDGRRLLYAITDSQTLVAADADFSGRKEVLIGRTAASPLEAALAPDGRTLVYRVFGQGLSRDIWVRRLDSAGSDHPLVATPFDERAIALSPRGLLAYVSNETGRDEVYVRPLEPNGGRWQVSDAGGTEPRWDRRGTILYYRSPDSLIAARLTPGMPTVQRREALFATRQYSSDLFAADYDVSPNGRQFVFIRRPESGRGQQSFLYVLLNGVAQ